MKVCGGISGTLYVVSEENAAIDENNKTLWERTFGRGCS